MLGAALLRASGPHHRGPLHLDAGRRRVDMRPSALRIAGIGERVADAQLNGDPDRRLPNNVNFTFAGVEAEPLLMGLDLAGIAASSGSACTAASIEPSHVLLAMGYSDEAARSTLVTVLDHSYRLLHPIVPFVTSELWSRLPWPEGDERPEDLIVAPWPDGSDGGRDEDAERDFEALRELIVQVRRLRKEYGVAEGEHIRIRLMGGDPRLLLTVQSQAYALERLARVGGVDEGECSGMGAHAVLRGGIELFVPLEGVIDVDAEKARLAKAMEASQKEFGSLNGRLNNANFVERAKPEAVEKARADAAFHAAEIDRLRAALARLG